MLIRHESMYCTIITYRAVYWQFLFSCMSRCSSNGNVITVHVLYTWYNIYGGESCAVLLCWAVLCCSSYYLCMLPPRSPKTFFVARKCSRIFQTNNKICTWSKKCQSALFWEKPYIALVVMANIKPYRVYVVWVIIWAKNTLYYIIPTRRKTERKHWVQQYVRDRCLVSFIWPDRNSYA